ncbi:MAG TPA: DNA-binding response regulator, partial [Desulfomicrobium sp.]|nr:DNA-binding response regulator [Desulfomicrobium sp.]
MTRQSILIIDDDQDIVKTVTANLELDGFAVRSASSGGAGLAAVEAQAPDLVL